MNKRIIVAAAAALLAASLAACSAPAESASSAAPAATRAASAATPQPSASVAPPPSVTASPSATTATQSQAAAVRSPFERSREVVASLVKGDQEGAAKNMTQTGSDAMLGRDMKDYLYGGRLVHGCQVSDHELTLYITVKNVGVKVFSSGRGYSTPGSGDEVSAVRVDCAEASFGIVVGTVGPRHAVDGMEGHPFPDDRYFAGS